MRIPMAILFAPILIMIVTVPLILKKVPKNNFYGMRTPRTLSGTDEQWYQANFVAGIYMFVAGFVSAVSCLVVPYFQHDVKISTMICTVVLLVSVLVAAGASMLCQ